MEKQEIMQRINSIKGGWFHCIDLGNNIITPGGQSINESLKKIKDVSNDLTGKTVLDVGCWEGFFSFEAEKRGAKVLATDHYVWHDSRFDGMKSFLLAREILNSKIEYQDIDVFNLSPETVGTFDIVLFLGVYYHLKDPILAFEMMYKITKEVMVVEGAIYKEKVDYPFMRFVPNEEVYSDGSVWWIPNVQCLYDMIKMVGFRKVEIKEIEGDDKGRAIIHAYK